MKTLLLLLLVFAKTMANDTGETMYSPASYGEDLPIWMFENSYIGISDPIKDTVEACEQAVNRALAFYALSVEMNLSSVYEYYYLNATHSKINHENQKSHWIAEFATSLENISYTIEKKYRTKYDETIVLLSISNDTVSNNAVDLSGSFMYHYEFNDNVNEYGEKQLLWITATTDTISSLEWNSTTNRSQNFKRSVNDGNENVLKQRTSIYNDFGEVTDDMMFSDNKYGLWNSFIDTFFQAISMFESKNVVIKNTARQISQENNESYGDKTQNISRLVMKTNIACNISRISLKDNCFYANWEIIEK